MIPITTPGRSRHIDLVLAMLALASMIAVGVLSTRAFAARSAARASLDHHAQVLALVNDLTQLRSRKAVQSGGRHPQPGLANQITDALISSGVPVGSLTNVSPESESTVQGAPDLRRQIARLALEPITLPALGRFLSTWRSNHPEWTIAAIQLVPVANTPQPGPNDAPAPVRVNLTIECTYDAEVS